MSTNNTNSIQLRDSLRKELPQVGEMPLDTSAKTDLQIDELEYKMEYPVTVNPPIQVTIPLAIQQILTAIPGSLTASFFISTTICGGNDKLFFAELLSTSIILAGICTILQTVIGVRLPILQGSSFSFLPPIAAMMTLKEWRCTTFKAGNGTENVTLNATDEWRPRMLELQGGLILASIVQFLIGALGLIGLIMRFIGPLTVAPTVGLVGLGLAASAADQCSEHWGIAVVTMAFGLLFAVFLGNISLCLPAYGKNGCHIVRVPLFRMFAFVFCIGFGWLLSFILTVAGALPSHPSEKGYLARTDARLEVLGTAKWLFFPYPLQWGRPTFGAAVFVGMLAATISSIIESVGDYFATANVSGVKHPPVHAINRGIAMEGFGSIIAGLLGTGHATTSYSGTIGMISLTKAASRLIWIVSGVMLIVLGVVGKFGAFLSLVPKPVLGAYMMLTMGMVATVGLSYLQHVDLSMSRNMVVLGFSFMLGLGVPQWMQQNPGVINTGVPALDQVITVILTTPMFLGGLLGFILDNAVPGSKKIRGLHGITASINDSQPDHIYDIPFITRWLRKITCCKYLPVSPTYIGITCSCKKKFTSSYKVSAA